MTDENKLTLLLTRAKNLKYNDTNDLDDIIQKTKMYLGLYFPKNPTYVSEVSQIKFAPTVVISGMDSSIYIEAWSRGQEKLVNLIDTRIEEYNLTILQKEKEKAHTKSTKFSKRHGHSTTEKEITIREDAPSALRDYILQLIYYIEYKKSFLRKIICRVLKVSPDLNNWSEEPNIEKENYDLIHSCEWYSVYDIIESLWHNMVGKSQEEFTNEINDYFKSCGIGWKLESGQIEARGNTTFETAVTRVTTVLETAKLQTAKSEIAEAIHDLSRRPKPDITGAIQHALACLECVCREIMGDKKSTLGDLMKKASGIIPAPLDQAVIKIWGFSSEQGRHLKEGQQPDYLEAELVVELTAAISAYLGKKLGGTDTSVETTEVKSDDLPF